MTGPCRNAHQYNPVFQGGVIGIPGDLELGRLAGCDGVMKPYGMVGYKEGLLL